MIRYDMIWSDIWYDMIWSDVMWYDMIWYDMIWYDMIWYDMIWCDVMWCDVMWYDMIWYDMIGYIIYVIELVSYRGDTISGWYIKCVRSRRDIFSRALGNYLRWRLGLLLCWSMFNGWHWFIFHVPMEIHAYHTKYLRGSRSVVFWYAVSIYEFIIILLLDLYFLRSLIGICIAIISMRQSSDCIRLTMGFLY